MDSKDKKRVLIVVGTRPEAIKLVSVIGEFRKHNSKVEVRVCGTAQHRQMLDQVLELFNVKLDYDLNLMKAGQDLTDVTTNVLFGLRTILKDFRPHWVVVQGDTTTAFAASLAAFYEKIAVAHVEAGLRTNDIYSPWPEEVNRRVVSKIASLHFPPTMESASNLYKENIDGTKVFVTGNTVIDALLSINRRIQNEPSLSSELAAKFSFIQSAKKLILVTGHRRESFGKGFVQICHSLRELAKRNDVQIVYPVHLNPNVQKPVHDILDGLSNIVLIEPQDYLPFVYLMSRAYLILTDSGGIQEEAPSLGKPVLVMRDTTERPEALAAGTSRLVGADQVRIVDGVRKLLDDLNDYNNMCRIHNPFGDGNAAARIVEEILRYE